MLVTSKLCSAFLLGVFSGLIFIGPQRQICTIIYSIIDNESVFADGACKFIPYLMENVIQSPADKQENPLEALQLGTARLVHVYWVCACAYLLLISVETGLLTRASSVRARVCMQLGSLDAAAHLAYSIRIRIRASLGFI